MPVSAARFLLAPLFCFILAFCALPARANDSMAALAAGGLRLVRTDVVRMVSEDLFISPDEIRVRYLFRAAGKKGVASLVAFPLPPVFVNNLDQEVGLPEPPKDNPLNLLDFHVQVDGRPVRPKVQARVLVAGVDRTELLEKYGIPLTDTADFEAFEKKLDNLPPEARKELEEAGLADWDLHGGADGKPVANYHWNLHVTFYWRQEFPAGRDVVVTHRYTPAAGAFFFVFPVEGWVKKTYCTDPAFLKAAREKIRSQGKGFAVLMGREVHYILTTARNWAGPIGRFRLVLDKKKPGNLISLCWSGALKKISPTRFEFTARDYTPEQDLKVLFLSPPPR